MVHLKLFESFLRPYYPKEITSQQWKDLEIIEYDQYGGIVKNSPIHPSLFREIVAIGGAEIYLPHTDCGAIIMSGRKPNTKHLYVLYFEPKDGEPPFYLIRFSIDHTPPERVQREQGLIKYYVARDFEQVKNFCKENL